MWFRFKDRTRKQYHNGKWYGRAEHWMIESDYRIDLVYPNKFEVYGDIFIPSPKGIGKRDLLDNRNVPRNTLREGGDSSMARFVKVRQNLLPVPENQGITKQIVTVTEEAEGAEPTVILQVEVGPNPTTEEMPTYWAEVGAGITVTVVYGDDVGTKSDPFEDSYMQDDMPAPIPPPGPTPEPPPTPVQIPAPTGVGTRELLDSVESDARPVQAMRQRRRPHVPRRGR